MTVFYHNMSEESDSSFERGCQSAGSQMGRSGDLCGSQFSQLHNGMNSVNCAHKLY